MQRASNPQIIRVSAAELSLIIESDFQGNVTYEFWVKAKNRKHEGLSSKIVQLIFDGTSNIDSIAGLSLKNMDEHSMTLSWDKIKKVCSLIVLLQNVKFLIKYFAIQAEGYIIQLVLPHPYPRIDPIKTEDTSVTVENLVNGAQYVARVSAYVKNYTGRSQSLILKRNGAPLPDIQGIQTSRENDNVKLSWSKPTVPGIGNQKITYGIYYGTNLEELFDLPKHKTEETSYVLSDLHECQSYLIGIGIVGPLGPGPLGKNPRAIETHFNDKKPPRNLSVSFDDTKHTMEISWSHSCSLSSTKYPTYIVSPNNNFLRISVFYKASLFTQITMREVVRNETTHVKVSSSTNATLYHTFSEVPRGAKYEISVATDVRNSMASNITATAMPLPAPRLMSIYPEKNGSYVVAWKEVKDMGNEK